MDRTARWLIVALALAWLPGEALAQQTAKPTVKSCFDICSNRPGLANGHQIQACTQTCEKKRAGKSGN